MPTEVAEAVKRLKGANPADITTEDIGLVLRWVLDPDSFGWREPDYSPCM